MEKLYKVIYMCKLQPKASHSEVVKKVSTLFKISTEKSEAFISSQKPKVIKKDLSYGSAQKYKNILSKIGLEVKITEITVAKPGQPHLKQMVTKNVARRNHEKIKSKINETKSLSEGEHSKIVPSFSETTDTTKSAYGKERAKGIKWYQVGYNKILGILIMLWGLGALIGFLETIIVNNSNIPRMLVICSIKLAIALIPIIVGIKIFRKKEYSKGYYFFWIILIMAINTGVFTAYQAKINKKIAYLKFALPQKVKHETRPSIVKATINDDVNEIKRLIAKGVDVNKKDGDGRTAIFFAHTIEIMKLLLDAGADVNIISNAGQTLLNSKAGPTNIQSYEATKLLLEHGLTRQTINSQKGYGMYNALHRSDLCLFCDELKDYTDGYKNVEVLIKNGANINAVNTKGETPVFTVNDKCKRIIIENGADIFVSNYNNENVLFRVKDYDLFMELVSRGLDYKTVSKKNETILHHTSNAQVIDFVAKEVDVNHKNHEGKTALFWCYYSPDKFRKLLQNNANVNITNNKGETVLHQYARNCRGGKSEYHKNLFKVVEMILETDIDINLKDNSGKTALDYVKYNKMKNLLIANGAHTSS